MFHLYQEEQKEHFNDLEDLLTRHREETAKRLSDEDSGQLYSVAELEAEVSDYVADKKEHHKAALEELESRIPQQNRYRRKELVRFFDLRVIVVSMVYGI